MNRFPYWHALLVVAILAAGFPGADPCLAASPRVAYTIKALTLDGDQDELRLRIAGDATPTYTAYRLFDPPRLVIDIAESRLPDRSVFPTDLPRGPVRLIRGRNLDDQDLAVLRLEIFLAGDPVHATTRRDNDIVIAFTPRLEDPDEEAAAEPSGVPGVPAPTDLDRGAVSAIIADLQGERHAGVVEAVRPRIPPLEFHAGPRTAATTAAQAAAKAAEPAPAKAKATPAPPAPKPAPIFGRTPRNVSVEFFKSDLHNVFRFFAEISDRNIVVDEGVSGQLTLTLREVPWDFALDIVLNLKDLQKEERFNTIVISPKAKAFVWPERTSDQLTISADGSLEEPEALTVRQRLEVPPERMRARDLLREGAKLEQRGDYPKALVSYEQALALWPENSQLAERLALINLVYLDNNARTLHYAASAIRHDPTNDRAALLAAIAAANMQKAVEAKNFFDQSIGQPQPAAEALISYAAFAEEYDSPHGALALLERHRQLFGDNLDTMVSKARLHEKTGNASAARQEYNAILFSGFELPEDLRRYILARIASEGE